MLLPVVFIFFASAFFMGIYSRFVFSVVSIFTLLNGWRLLSSAYLNQEHAVFAPELKKLLVSSSLPEVILLAVLLLFWLAILIVFNPKQLANFKVHLQTPLSETRTQRLFQLFAGVSLCYLAYIAMTLVLSAPLSDYPIFSGTHRRLFMIQYGSSPLLALFFKTLTYASLFLGMGQLFFLIHSPAKRAFRWLPFLAWVASFIFLLFLGHKFSSLLWTAYFFALPLSLLFLTPLATLANRLFMGLALTLSAAVAAMFIHQFVIGGFHSTEKFSYMKRRILVDQSQLWNSTVTRVFTFGNTDAQMASATILTPHFPENIYNRSAQFLMFKELGEEAYASWDESHIITMSYPESFVDLVGGGPMFLWSYFSTLVLALLLSLFFYFLSQFEIISALGIAYLMNPMIYFFLGGTANAVLSIGYFAKIVLVAMIISGLQIYRNQEEYLKQKARQMASLI